MKITVIGTGYVGLVCAACFADVGNDVMCLDLDPNKVETLEGGTVPIYEPGLQDLVSRNITAGRLRFTTDVQRASQFGTVQFIAVATPSRRRRIGRHAVRHVCSTQPWHAHD